MKNYDRYHTINLSNCSSSGVDKDYEGGLKYIKISVIKLLLCLSAATSLYEAASTCGCYYMIMNHACKLWATLHNAQWNYDTIPVCAA